jgi:hypothetical protein
MDERSEVHRLLYEIANSLDVEPDVFTVTIQAGDHYHGYRAWVDFRANSSNARSLSNVRTRADSPEQALRDLRDVLVDKFGTCPKCGRKGPVP